MVQLLLGVESFQVEEILFEQMNIGLEKGLSESLGGETTALGAALKAPQTPPSWVPPHPPKEPALCWLLMPGAEQGYPRP